MPETTQDNPVERALRKAVNENAPWPGLRDERDWSELPDDERDHWRFLVRRVREAIAIHG